MRAVNRRICTLAFVGVVSLLSTASQADEKEDAIAAAKTVIAALAEKKFPLMWDTLASDWYKKDLGYTRDGFITVLTMSRRDIGRLTSSTVLNVRFNAPQPNVGFKGKSYAVVFENTYTTGKRLEGALVVQENGRFKMGGLSP
jgi:hypothetical protein